MVDLMGDRGSCGVFNKGCEEEKYSSVVLVVICVVCLHTHIQSYTFSFKKYGANGTNINQMIQTVKTLSQL